jgi:hypothetical protein
LTSKRGDLSGRTYFEASSKHWYELWCQRDLDVLARPKIVVPELAEGNRFALADTRVFYGDTVCGIVLRPEVEENILYVLGVLNSKLVEFYYQQTTVPKANAYFIYKTMFLKPLPIRRIDFSNKADKARHDKMVELVTRMMELKKQQARAPKKQSPGAKQLLDQKLAITDHQIDALVYELYGLTEQEIEIVEGVAT